MRYIKHWMWFVRESQSFMDGHNSLLNLVRSIPKAFTFARDMRRWEKLTPQQKEAWYLSGEGRTMEF